MWNAPASVDTYQTTSPAVLQAGASVGWTFRTSPAVGIVYVTGGYGTPATPGSGAIAQLPAGAPWCPQQLVLIPTDVSGVTVGIAASGAVFLNGGAGSTVYTLRSFYFTTVTPP